MEQQHHQDANKNEDPQHHGIHHSTVQLWNKDLHGQNKKDVTGIWKQVSQKNHESEIDKENNKWHNIKLSGQERGDPEEKQ